MIENEFEQRKQIMDDNPCDNIKVSELTKSYFEDETSIYEYDFPCLKNKKCK